MAASLQLLCGVPCLNAQTARYLLKTMDKSSQSRVAKHSNLSWRQDTDLMEEEVGAPLNWRKSNDSGDEGNKGGFKPLPSLSRYKKRHCDSSSASVSGQHSQQFHPLPSLSKYRKKFHGDSSSATSSSLHSEHRKSTAKSNGGVRN